MKVGISGLYQNHLQNVSIPKELSRALRRADEFIQLAVVAAFEVVQKEKLQLAKVPDDCGLILGTTFGTMETNFSVLGQIVSGQQSSPILFSHSVFNAAAGYMASIFNIQGCALTVTDFAYPFFRALQEGYLAVKSGRIKYCLVVQVETYSTLLHDARRTHGVDEYPWHGGVVCWLLEEREDDENILSLDCIDIDDKKSTPLDFLRYCERVEMDDRIETTHDPLAAAMIVSGELCRRNSFHLIRSRIKGPWGEVRLCFNENRLAKILDTRSELKKRDGGFVDNGK